MGDVEHAGYSSQLSQLIKCASTGTMISAMAISSIVVINTHVAITWTVAISSVVTVRTIAIVTITTAIFIVIIIITIIIISIT